MSKLRNALSSIRYRFSYYFVRKKSPLSYIWWRDILRREISSEGMYNVAIATVEPDCAISLSSGAPSDNHMEICVYDTNNRLRHRVQIKLSYKSMKKIRAGFNEAQRESRKILKEEGVSYDR